MRVTQSKAWFPIDLCFQNTYASKTLAHDPALTLLLEWVKNAIQNISLGKECLKKFRGI